MLKRLQQLLIQYPSSRLCRESGVPVGEIKAVIDYGHVHLSETWPDPNSHSLNGIVIGPDNVEHHIQVEVEGKNAPRLCCITCRPQGGSNRHCAQAIAAYLVALSEVQQPAAGPKVCGSCGRELS